CASSRSRAHRALHSFPTRRSSDLSLPRIVVPQEVILKPAQQQAQKVLSDTVGALLEAQFSIRTFVKAAPPPPAPAAKKTAKPGGDRKSTRLNSSHDQISYAVFCLK